MRKAGWRSANTAANVIRQLRRLDVKAAIKKVPEELKPHLEEADVPNS